MKTLDKIKGKIGEMVKATLNNRVVIPPGLFGGGIKIEGYKKPVIAATTDGVGTKLLVAKLAEKYDSLGQDIVNHSINDLLCVGALPLFFQDYIGYSQLSPEVIASMIEGIARACKKESIILLGGETAQLPGIYKPGDFDLVGTMVGVVEEDAIIDGKKIKEKDILVGLKSNGLHTNGYSLARKVFFEKMGFEPSRYIPELGKTLAEELLKPHRSYKKELSPILQKVHGLAHITGGGFEGNIKRILPKNLDCVIELKKWEPPAIFKLIKEMGDITQEEMYRVFNMGIGMVVFIPPEEKIIQEIDGIQIGYVKKGNGKVILV